MVVEISDNYSVNLSCFLIEIENKNTIYEKISVLI